MQALYISELLSAGCDLTGMCVQVRCENRMVSHFSTRFYPGWMRHFRGHIAKTQRGRHPALVLRGRVEEVSYERLLAICSVIEFENGQEVALRSDAPDHRPDCEEYGKKLYRYFIVPQTTRMPLQEPCRAAAMVTGRSGDVHQGHQLFKEKHLTPKSISQRLPEFYIVSSAVKTSGTRRGLSVILGKAAKRPGNVVKTKKEPR
jgi:hypothetical protein